MECVQNYTGECKRLALKAALRAGRAVQEMDAMVRFALSFPYLFCCAHMNLWEALDFEMDCM